jgi:ABC-type glycerol-3-phosphate transport system substrate-binding protein
MNTHAMPVVVAGLALLAPAGCGSDGSKGGAEVSYNCAANADDIRQLEAELPGFKDSTGITIKLNPFTGQEKLYAMMAAGQAPDIFYTNNTMRDRLAAEGRLLDLRTVSQDDPFVQRLWPSVIEGGRCVDGGWYNVGNWSYTLGIYYNKELFDAAGVPYPDTAWTWSDMVERARRLTRDTDRDGTPDQYGIFIGSHFVEAIELMNGADIRPNALTAEIAPASAEAFRSYLSLMRENIMPDVRRIQAMGMQPSQLLAGGRVAMLAEAVPHQMLTESLHIRWGVAPLPRFAGKPVRYFRSGSGGLSVSSGTRNPKAAWKALAWLVGSAPVYQPNPVLRDLDFAGAWEKRYPQLVGSGFREVWALSLKHDGGDPRFFVRFSSWTSAAILERLQPQLDRLWAGDITVDELIGELPQINGGVKRALNDLLKEREIRPAFRADIERALKSLDHGSPH